MLSKQHVSFLCNNLLLSCIIPTPYPPDATIVHRITLAIVIFAIAPALGSADTILDSNAHIADQVVELSSCDKRSCLPDERFDEIIITSESRESSLANGTAVNVGEQRNLNQIIDDRLWIFDSRALSHNVCTASLSAPAFQVAQLDPCGNLRCASTEEFLSSLVVDRPVLIQVHGNRMDEQAALERGIFVYRNTVPHCGGRPIDFLIFSWPSDREGILLRDGRAKAQRTDAEGLYLAWIIRELVERDIPVAIIGFSFGGRIATGALHAMAGGKLAGRTLPGEHHVGAEVNVGLIAPALEDDWLRSGSYHGLATQNIRQMTILYNRRDAVLKRYWLLDKVRGSMALGFTGPKGIGPRVDGSPMPVFSRDCSTTLGIRHDEQKYYTQACRAGQQMATLITLPQ